jgi:peptidoglycan/LPS O-acetylase OafA/YrhL
MLGRMRRMRYFEAGDAMRGWGVLGVVLAHCASTALFFDALGDPGRLRVLQRTRDLGFERLFDSRRFGAAILALQLVVYLFFALSAYLLSRPYVAALLDDGARRPPLGAYVRHRLGRVVPAFWAMILITLVWFGADGTPPGELAAMAAFGQSWTAAPFNAHLGQAWTLDVEAVFYVVLPLVAGAAAWLWSRGGALRGPLALLPALVLVAAAVALSTAGLPASTPVAQSPVGGLVTFVPGILIAVVEVRWGARLARLRWGHVAAVVLALAGLALAYKQLSAVRAGSAGERNLATVAAGLVLSGVVLWQLTGRRTWRALRWSWARWVGERSFSIYLVHGLVLYELHQVGAGQPTVGRYFALLALAALPACVLAGAVLYALVERPAIRLSRHERPLFRGGAVRTGSPGHAGTATAPAVRGPDVPAPGRPAPGEAR